MPNLRPFQIILLGVFAGLALLSLIFFALFQSSSTEDARLYGNSVIIWGILDNQAFKDIFNEIVDTDKDFQVVRYIEKDPRTFDLDLLNAIATGDSPDLIILPSDRLVTHRDKLFALSYESVPERTFRDTYVDGSEIFLLNEGVYGLPFAVDPLVMFWNRDLLSSSGLATPPQTWEELVSITTPAITRIGQEFTIERSAVAFGEYENVTNAKAILSMLFLQSGTPIVTEGSRTYEIVLNRSTTSSLPPAEAALSFYTEFALPSAPQYSWSRSLPLDGIRFTGGDLGLYFGLGSEYNEIERNNPNLNFDVAEVPQGADATVKRNFGVFYTLAIPQAAANKSGAFGVAQVLSGRAWGPVLASALNLAPVHRVEIASGTTDPYRRVLYTSALTTRGWLDPDPEASGGVFQTLVEDITSGRLRVSEAVSDAAGRLELLFN